MSSGVAIVCGGCGRSLDLADDRCAHCGRSMPHSGGVPDFAAAAGERASERDFYEGEYAEGDRAPDLHPSTVRPEDLEPGWHSAYNPENREVLARVGDVQGKVVVALGNGGSTKELFLLTRRPRALVVSDLSPSGLAYTRARVDASGYRDALYWAAIDAFALPFPDATVDVVYGYAFVHHLDDVPRFLREVARVLRPGGRAVFLDDAYSPIWQGAKRTVLRPLMRWSHRRQPISAEDERFTLAGGFRPAELAREIEALGGRPFFVRSGFVHYLWTRGWERLASRDLARRATGEGVTVPLARLDRRLARVPGVRDNLIRLVWGWEVP